MSDHKPIVKQFMVRARKYDPANPLPVKIMDPTFPERVRRFVASDDTLDRYREVVLASGAVLDNYVANPVIAAFHDYSIFPIGHAVGLGVRDNQLVIDAEFDPPEVDELAEKVLRKIDLRSVNTGSIGFLPLESVSPGSVEGKEQAELFVQYAGAHRIYTKWELLEFSIVPIPANPNALAAALQADAIRRFGAESITADADSDAGMSAAVAERISALERRLQ